MIRIVTDSDANLPPDVAEEYNILIVPISVVFGDEVLRERIDITDAEFFERIATAPKLPTTSQPTIAQFEAVYSQLLQEDPGATILSIHISGKLSGTIDSGRKAAASFPDADIRLFDSRSASIGQSLLIQEAAQMARDGAAIEAILARLEVMRDGMQIYFLVDTLEYLARGGRIGRASHLMGTALAIKPILTLHDGIVEAFARHRTRRRALAALRNLAMEDGRGKRGLRLAVAHAACEEAGRKLADSLRSALQPEVFLFCELGPGLGVHTGPNALGVGWYAPPE